MKLNLNLNLNLKLNLNWGSAQYSTSEKFIPLNRWKSLDNLLSGFVTGEILAELLFGNLIYLYILDVV